MSARGAGPVRVIVAGGSPTSRSLLVSSCHQDGDIHVVGEAADGKQAVFLTQQMRPALVLIDVQITGVDVLDATKAIMRNVPTPILVVTADTSPGDVETGLSAIRLGALNVIPKPVAPGEPGHRESVERFASMVKALSDVKVIRRRTGRAEPPRTQRGPGGRVLAVAASTGGPPALCTFLQHLPGTLPMPVVVVQHLAAGFLDGLIDWLRVEVPFHVASARDQVLEPGTVYLAPDGRHLEVTEQLRARLSDGPSECGFKPSASVLFRSVARSAGAGGTAVVLTGMGEDGLSGARELHAAGGRVLAQDPESCAVYGMPRAVVDAGIADRVGSVEELAAVVTDSVRS